MKKATFLLGAFACAWTHGLLAEQRPVMIGGEADLDACGSSGQVVGLDKGGDNFLSVRAGPGAKEREIDRIYQGKQVILCDTSKDGKWLGILYDLRGEDCGAGSPIPKRRPYRGPCKSGWVFHRYVEITAG